MIGEQENAEIFSRKSAEDDLSLFYFLFFFILHC